MPLQQAGALPPRPLQATDLLAVWRPDEGSANLAQAAKDQRDRLRTELVTRGGILFRGFDVRDVTDFTRFLEALDMPPMDYVYRSTPRNQVARDVFTATEYPRQQEIPLHNENAYQRRWPLGIAFYCEQPASSGGETTIADMRQVTRAVSPTILRAFAEKGVLYTRHYREHVDLPWQTVFQTESKADLAAFCAAAGIEHEWLPDGTLRTRQRCQGVATHPFTKDVIFFNQAHLFHRSSLGNGAARALVEMFGADRLPRDACFGTGEEIPSETFEQVRAAFAGACANVDWRAGDIVLLDNMRMAHGRRSFEGSRRVLTALLAPHSADEATAKF